MKSAEYIIEYFYAGNPDLKNILILHSTQVKNKALQIAANSGVTLDLELAATGAMLHDIGIIRCHAPDIFCPGDLPYIAHGTAGSEMLRQLGSEYEAVARICERHTGSGLTAAEIIDGKLPLPPVDLLPETAEEKLICLADKFFSKSGKMEEKPLSLIRKQMAKFGEASLKRFDELAVMFNIGC